MTQPFLKELGKNRKKGWVNAIFITGTDTGVGKTLVTGCLFRYLTQKGYSVITQKWVQTGCDSILSSDIKTHFKIARRLIDEVKEYLPLILPNIFKNPASPHLSSRLENKKIGLDKIKNSFRSLSKKFDFVIVEGAGGMLVPLSKNKLLIDIVKELRLPVLIVAANKLGAINHTLLTIESLNARKIKILGLVFNNLAKQNSLILKDNPQAVKTFTGIEIFGILPLEPNCDKLYKKFMPIGAKIVKLIRANG